MIQEVVEHFKETHEAGRKEGEQGDNDMNEQMENVEKEVANDAPMNVQAEIQENVEERVENEAPMNVQAQIQENVEEGGENEAPMNIQVELEKNVEKEGDELNFDNEMDEETESDEDVEKINAKKKKEMKTIPRELDRSKKVWEKKTKRLAEAKKSPYYKRSVTVHEKWTEEETCSWAYLHTDLGTDENFRFHVHKQEFQSMDGHVVPKVIDAWSYVLNDQEHAKSTGKPLRLMGYVIQSDVEFNIDAKKEFTSKLKVAADLLVDGDTKKIEMILIPMLLENDHYILISFNLKNPGIEIIDFLENDKGKELYERVTQVVRNLVEHYLEMRSLHVKKKKISDVNVKPKIVNVPWREKKRQTTGICTMRAMELYMGVEFKKWETEITNRNAVDCLKKLRVKYLRAILHSKVNELRNRMVKTLEEYKKGLKIMRPFVHG